MKNGVTVLYTQGLALNQFNHLDFTGSAIIMNLVGWRDEGMDGWSEWKPKDRIPVNR